jgi:hypothetical protein
MGYHEHIWFHQCQEDINSFILKEFWEISLALIANPIDWLFAACLEYIFFLDRQFRS